jgi:hypothetical protein
MKKLRTVYDETSFGLSPFIWAAFSGVVEQWLGRTPITVGICISDTQRPIDCTHVLLVFEIQQFLPLGRILREFNVYLLRGSLR